MNAKNYVQYRSNNSGGEWWLSDEDWSALEAAGWRVVWVGLTEEYDEGGSLVCDETGMPVVRPVTDEDKSWVQSVVKSGRWLGAKATTAYRSGLDMRAASDEWERVTGKSPLDAGCPCYGQPHNFTEYRDGKWTASGPETSYSASW